MQATGKVAAIGLRSVPGDMPGTPNARPVKRRIPFLEVCQTRAEVD